MKKLTILLALLLVAAMLCACGAASVQDAEETGEAGDTEETGETRETMPPPPTPTDPTTVGYPYDYTDVSFFEIEKCLDYAPKCKLIGPKNNAPVSFKAGDGYVVAQGACSDGTYGYFALCNTSAMIDGEFMEAAKIVKMDLSTWEVVTVSDPVRTCHSNGMCYNSKTGKLLVVHNKPEFQKISVIDPDTLKVEKVITIDRYIQSIGYSATRDQYVVRISGTWDFAVLDADFNEVGYYETGVRTPLSSQCMTCDDEYIYMLDSGVLKMPGTECFTVYDWEGNYLGVYRIPSAQESEAIIIHQGTFYLTFFNGNGGRIYEMEFDTSLLENWVKE